MEVDQQTEKDCDDAIDDEQQEMDRATIDQLLSELRGHSSLRIYTLLNSITCYTFYIVEFYLLRAGKFLSAYDQTIQAMKKRIKYLQSQFFLVLLILAIDIFVILQLLFGPKQNCKSPKL